MYRCLSPGAAGIKASLEEALTLARKNGFEGLEVSIGEMSRRAESEGIEALQERFTGTKVRPAAWGLPVDWQGEEERFREDLRKLEGFARVARQLGCTRTATWIPPASNTRSYQENYEFHVGRFTEIARVLGHHGCSLGLEFIGPATIRRNSPHPFIYKMEEMLGLAADCGPNVGLLLDCWHWYTSGGTKQDLEKLRPEQVVYVHVNDAPRGVALEDHIDNQRAMPGETGVIDIAVFLQTLNAIGYDGPVTPEPFNPELSKMSAEDAARVTGDSMKKIWSIAGLG